MKLQHNMTTPLNDTRRFFAALAVGVSVIAGIAGLLGAWMVLPTKMELMGNRVSSIENKQDRDHDLLLRIEERLINVQKENKNKP